jgi:hypothetical protein
LHLAIAALAGDEVVASALSQLAIFRQALASGEERR